MVRPAPARAHPSPAARGAAAPDRAGLTRSAAAVPLLLAARGTGQPAARARRPAAGGRAAAGLRGRGGGLGARDPGRADERLPARLARRALPLRRSHLGPAPPAPEPAPPRPAALRHRGPRVAAAAP